MSAVTGVGRSFSPAKLLLPKSGSGTAALARAARGAEARRSAAAPTTQLPHNATYRVSLSAFDYAEERVAVSPHEMLRAYAEMNLGNSRISCFSSDSGKRCRTYSQAAIHYSRTLRHSSRVTRDFAYKRVLDSLTPLVDAGLTIAAELKRAGSNCARDSKACM